MVDTLQLIEQSLRRGGRNLTAKDIAGDTKAAATIVKRLVEEGIFQKEGARYVLTSTGRQRWDREAPADRKKDLDASATEAFLRCVETKKGKALTSADLQKHKPSTREAAQRDGYAKPRAKPNSYAVTEKGQQFLLARLPLTDQISRLKDFHRDLMSGLAATTARLKNDLGAISTSIQAVSASLFTEGERKLAELGTYLEELESQGKLAEIASRVKEELSREHAAAIRKLDEETKKLQERECRLSEEAEEQERRVKEGAQWIQDRLEKMTVTVAEKGPAPTRDVSSLRLAGNSDGIQLTDAIVRVVHEHHRETRDVPLTLPEVFSRVRTSAGDIPLGKFHDAIRELFGKRAIRLDAYTRSLATIPDRTNALFVDGEVMYYVRPA